ncbi:MAG: YeeE/YedE family protein [Thermodesulfovibrionales bacterium]|nr:YeeE/YedE family protein [Thermodesulfovibrionales bacterium]
MNTAFRDVIFINDLTMFRSWLIALGIAIIGSNFIEDVGLLGDDGLRRQVFSPISAIVGGYLFGIGIVIAGGCGSGVLYKQGEGQFAALVATFGFAVSLIASLHGPLNPIVKALKSYKVAIGSGDDAITTPALWDFFGQSLYIKWAVIAVVIAIIIPIVFKGKPFSGVAKKGWTWSAGGAIIGLLVILAWWASYYFGGQARGLSFSGPTVDFLMFGLTGNSQAPFDPMFSLFGIGILTWSALYVVGVPIGAYMSAKGLKEFKLTAPKQADELLRVFIGGLIMGFGAIVAGG